MVDLSVIICTHNRFDVLHNAIMSLKYQTLGPEKFEIVVVDNSGDRDASIYISQRYKDVSNLRWVIESIPGLANARNAGVLAATAELVAFIDDDAVASETWAEYVLNSFNDTEVIVAAIGGPVRPLWSEPRPEWLADGLLGYLSLVDHGSKNQKLSQGRWVAGTNMAFRKRDILDAGLFDRNLGRVGSELTLLSNEETELLDRLYKAGKSVLYVADALVYHQINNSRLTRRWFRRRAAWQALSDYIRNPEHHSLNYENYMDEVKRYMIQYAETNSTLAILSQDVSSSDQFHWQVTAVYNFTFCLISGLFDHIT